MGLDLNDVLFLVAAKKRGLELGDTVTLGRLDLMVYPAKIREVFARAGIAPGVFAEGNPTPHYSEGVFQCLGARSVTAMDFSDYEGAQVLHDLNQPIRDELKQKYDLVYDGGTLEHVFNFPVALKSCMEMVREGGRLIIHGPANNWCGHGFYQFSPELFYSAFSEANGYEVERMVLHVVGPYNRWYEVADPRTIRSRVELYNWAAPLLIMVQARRKRVVPIFPTPPLQSDYVPQWEAGKEPVQATAKVQNEDGSALVRMMPGLARLRRVIRNGWKMVHGNSLGNRVKFTPVDKYKWD